MYTVLHAPDPPDPVPTAARQRPALRLVGADTAAQAAMVAGQWRDIAPVFNLIQQASAQGHVNRLYLQPRYQAGLALQLFGVHLLGRLRLPGGRWRAARLQVLRAPHDSAVLLGFTLSAAHGTDGAAPERNGQPPPQEIYLCAVHPDHRGAGWGRAMLQAVLGQWPPATPVHADCLPASAAMKRLLRQLGFSPVPTPADQAVQHFVRPGHTRPRRG
jgi:GNAT superfamily N-acetyltransferase